LIIQVILNVCANSLTLLAVVVNLLAILKTNLSYPASGNISVNPAWGLSKDQQIKFILHNHCYFA
jgi:hypothetical protein